MEEEVEAWRLRTPSKDTLQTMQDGKVWKEIKAPDGSCFFANPGPNDELRLGVTLGLDFCSDWYGYKIFDLASDANQYCMTCLVCLVEQETTAFISIWCVCGIVRQKAASPVAP